MQRAVQLLICVKNDVCVYVIEKCELILGGACATYSHKGELCFIICGYLCIVMLHAVDKGDFSVAHRQYSGFCHCRVSLRWRAGFCWRTWSLEDRASLEDAVSCTHLNWCKNDAVCVCIYTAGFVQKNPFKIHKLFPQNLT